MSQYDSSAEWAAVAAGYGDQSSFRRAAREALAAPLRKLLSEWDSTERLVARLGPALLRA